MTAIIRASMQAGLHDRVKHACATAAVQHRTPAPAKSHVPTALLSFFSHAPDPAVGAHARRPQRLCSQVPAPPQSLQVCLLWLCSQMLVPPLSLHLLLSRLCSQMPAPSQSLHSVAFLAVMLADAGAPAVLALAPVALMLAHADAHAVLAPAPDAVMLADAGAPEVLIPSCCGGGGYSGRCWSPRSACNCS